MEASSTGTWVRSTRAQLPKEIEDDILVRTTDGELWLAHRVDGVWYTDGGQMIRREITHFMKIPKIQ